MANSLQELLQELNLPKKNFSHYELESENPSWARVGGSDFIYYNSGDAETCDLFG